MRWSQTLIPTQKETPADAQIVSHQLMIRAGLIRQVTAGAYDFLPLGWRALHKASKIVREEMDAIGCAEVLMPTLQPLEFWQQTGRDVSYGENLMKLTDRHGRKMVLGPTHEEVTTEMIKAYVSSYKQLPLSVYQIQTKFRDEYRPRFGLLRVREFTMKDAYSFHADIASLDKVYLDFYHAYERIFTRCGIPYAVVEAESGPIGGSASHEFMAACSAGEDTILTSDKGNYSANMEKAETGERPWEIASEVTGDLQLIDTPNIKSIEDLCEHWPKLAGGKLRTSNVLKSLVYKVSVTASAVDSEKVGAGDDYLYYVAVVRGDHEVNEAKVRQAIQKRHSYSHWANASFALKLLEIEEAEKAGFKIGFVGPHVRRSLKTDEVLDRTYVIADYDAVKGGFWVAGANEVDKHCRHFSWARDLLTVGPSMPLDQAAGHVRDIISKEGNTFAVADIRNAADGDPSPKNDGGKLKASKGIEIGHVFKLGTKYSVAMDAKFIDEKGERLPFIMGCYGIGVGRILIAAIESLHDDKGIVWPAAIAPYQCVITPIKYEGEVKDLADKLHDELNAAGIDTILDDRDARPGFKFADADLVGFPVRINIGDRGLKEGKVEMKKRTEKDATMVSIDGILQAVRDALK